MKVSTPRHAELCVDELRRGGLAGFVLNADQLTERVAREGAGRAALGLGTAQHLGKSHLPVHSPTTTLTRQPQHTLLTLSGTLRPSPTPSPGSSVGSLVGQVSMALMEAPRAFAFQF